MSQNKYEARLKIGYPKFRGAKINMKGDSKLANLKLGEIKKKMKISSKLATLKLGEPK